MKTLRPLFLEELADRYDGEKQLVHYMPTMVSAATCTHLKPLLQEHLTVMTHQVKELERVFEAVHERPQTKRCEAIMGLLKETTEMAAHFKGSPAINAALISSAQKIEHYKIASYGCLQEWATVLDFEDAALILEAIAEQGGQTNKALIELARNRSNKEALGEESSGGNDGTSKVAQMSGR